MRLSPRTKLALLQNSFVGIPVVIAISVLNALTSNNPSPLIHGVGSAVVGYSVSLVFLALSLRVFKVKSRYDDKPEGKKETITA